MTQLKVLPYSLKKYQSAQNILAINLMQTIINIQIFTRLTTQGIYHYTGRMNAPAEQLTSRVKKEKKMFVEQTGKMTSTEKEILAAFTASGISICEVIPNILW